MKGKIAITILVILLIIGIGSNVFANNCPDFLNSAHIPPYILNENIKIICINEGGMIRTGNTRPTSQGGPEAIDHVCSLFYQGADAPQRDENGMHNWGWEKEAYEYYKSAVIMNTPVWRCVAEKTLPPYAAYILTSSVDSDIPENIYNSETMTELFANLYNKIPEEFQDLEDELKEVLIKHFNPDLIEDIFDLNEEQPNGQYSEEILQQITSSKISLKTMEMAIKYGYMGEPQLGLEYSLQGSLAQEKDIEETENHIQTTEQWLKESERNRYNAQDRAADFIYDLEDAVYAYYVKNNPFPEFYYYENESVREEIIEDILPTLKELAYNLVYLNSSEKDQDKYEELVERYTKYADSARSTIKSIDDHTARNNEEIAQLEEAMKEMEQDSTEYKEAQFKIDELKASNSRMAKNREKFVENEKKYENLKETYNIVMDRGEESIDEVGEKVDSILPQIQEMVDTYYTENKENIEYEKTIEAFEGIITELENTKKYRHEVEFYKWILEELDIILKEYKVEDSESEKIVLDEAWELYQESMKFEEFYNKTQEDGGYITKDISGKKNVLVDTKKSEYIVGPFKLDYRKESIISTVTGEKITFGAITGMSVEKNDGTLIPEEEIEIIRSPIEVKEDPYYKYPNPYEEFYVKIKVKDVEEAAGIRLKVDFAWLDKCYGFYHRLEGEGDILGWVITERHDKHDHGEGYSGCWYLKLQLEVVGQYPAQILIGVESKSLERQYRQKSLYVGKNNDGGDGDDPTTNFIPLTMELGGMVFKEAKLNKEGTADGLYLDGYLCQACGQTIAKKIGENINSCPYCGAGTEQLETLKETLVEGVTVTIYEEGSEEPYKLVQENEENPRVEESEKEIRTNPTITDENGRYSFKGLDPMKKYYVKFTYNGQPYQATYYMNRINEQGQLESFDSAQAMVNANLYNTNDWAINSKAKEWQDEREAYNESFLEIGSNPSSYVSSNSLGYLQLVDGNKGQNYYNIAYSKNIMTHTTFSYDEEGNWQENHDEENDLYIRVNKKIKEYIKEHKEYPDIAEIYESIIKEEEEKRQRGQEYDAEIKNKLQFMEDCKMDSYTSSKNPNELEYYPIYDKFIIDSMPNNQAYKISYMVSVMHDPAKGTNYADIAYGEYIKYPQGEVIKDHSFVEKGENEDGIMELDISFKVEEKLDADNRHGLGGNKMEFPPIYPGQKQINLGIMDREEFDMALRKDVYKTTLKINGKTQVYDYDKREIDSEKDLSDEEKIARNTVWDIEMRTSDLSKYYNQISLEDASPDYIRDIFKSDYDYKVDDYIQDTQGNNNNQEILEAIKNSKDIKDELQIFITYKIAIRNQSQSVLGEVTEIVDYYDKDLKYRQDLSFLKYQDELGDNKDLWNDTEELTADEQFHNAMEKEDINQMIDVREIVSSEQSMYKEQTQTTIEGYNAIYLSGLENKKIATGETAYAYVTFEVLKDKDRYILLDEDQNAQNKGVGKENIAEINGYRTYYRDGTEIPNIGKTENNKIAGIIDRDSNPGNIKPEDVPKDGEINYEGFEDDTDKAPNIRLRIYRDDEKVPIVRSINGTVWEDVRDQLEQEAWIGNGLKEEGETRITGVTVQLVELIENKEGTGYYEYIWKEFYSGQTDNLTYVQNKDNPSGKIEPETYNDLNGKSYDFRSYQPGNYIIRFKYGDTEKTIVPNEANKNISYNGQDFKSTIYQMGIDQEKVTDTRGDKKVYQNEGKQDYTEPIYERNTTGSYLYDIKRSDLFSNISDAKDIMTGQTQQYDREFQLNRSGVIDYSKENVLNHKAEVLASPYEIPEYDKDNDDYNGKEYTYSSSEIESLQEELAKNTQMRAETGIIGVEVEYDREMSDGYTKGYIRNEDGELVLEDVSNNKEGEITYAYGNDVNGNYTINDVDFGMQERPRAQLELNNKVENIKITLANNYILFDAKNTVQNLLWTNHGKYELDKQRDANGGIYKRYAGNERDISTYYKSDVDEIVKAKQGGLAQITIDEEVMENATIEITYELTVKNVGEIDYNENEFYYTGKNGNEVVKTMVNDIVNYVTKNMQFIARDNTLWEVIEKEELIKQEDSLGEDNLINYNLKNNLNNYNTILHIANEDNELVKWLQPDEETTQKLKLSQMISSQNKTDDLTYQNIAEIIETSNEVGRRMAYSVVGNQDPTTEPDEVDSDRAEEVKILPPYGAKPTYIILALSISMILIFGIVFIKKKVLYKK